MFRPNALLDDVQSSPWLIFGDACICSYSLLLNLCHDGSATPRMPLP
ncbi:unnamed protein product, partial [Rotaria magnacalcarata]